VNEESTSGICDEVRRIAANIAKLAAAADYGEQTDVGRGLIGYD
jgi:hypothetical protein